jgi:hypothetical protein
LAENRTLDALANEEAHLPLNLACGVTPEMIKAAVHRELASLAAKRILPKLEAPGAVQPVKLEGF